MDKILRIQTKKKNNSKEWNLLLEKTPSSLTLPPSLPKITTSVPKKENIISHSCDDSVGKNTMML